MKTYFTLLSVLLFSKLCFAVFPETTDFLIEKYRHPLHFALKHNYPEEDILDLIKKGVSPDQLGATQKPALSFALKEGYSLEVIEKLIPSEGLIQTDANGKLQFDLVKEFFHMVFLKGVEKPEITHERIKWLLTTYPQYVNYEDFNKGKNSVLHLVTKQETAVYLLSKYQIPYLKLNKEGLSIVDLLVLHRNLYVNKIKEINADSNVKNNEIYQTQKLIYEQIAFNLLTMIDFWVKKDQRFIDTLGRYRLTSLHRAEHSSTISVLLKLGFDMSAKDDYKQNPLHISVRLSAEDSLDRFRAFLEHDPKQFEKAFNAKDAKGLTPKDIFKSSAPEKYEIFEKELIASRSAAVRGQKGKTYGTSLSKIINYLKSKARR